MQELLSRLGIGRVNSGVYSGRWIPRPSGGSTESINPANGEVLATVLSGGREDYEQTMESSRHAFGRWQKMPAPQRGEIVRQIGNSLRRHKEDLGLLVTLEAGKIRSEGAGEVQEMIDMCDFAVGLSRQLYGLTMPSERPEHRMFEQWHPLGLVGIITAFNFPVAVWAWNASLALVAGDTCIWKPSLLTPLTSIAVQNIVNSVLEPLDLQGVLNLCLGEGATVGQWLADDPRIPLLSFTGSCAVGRRVAVRVAERLGRSLLELGGNNSVIVTPTANADLALRAVTFAAVGTAGQRCTTLRRLILHESLLDSFLPRLVAAYRSIPIGDPADSSSLMGPLIRPQAVAQMLQSLAQAEQQGGQLLCGGSRIAGKGNFVEPAIVRAAADMPIVREETFAPILYVLSYRDFDEAVAIQNSVSQGLSSAVFTDRIEESERFLSAVGSDCGIANVNIGTSGAEIGGAFGGEKETGGGREAGSDAWKAYMRRQTCTVNYGNQMPLAQGVRFEIL